MKLKYRLLSIITGIFLSWIFTANAQNAPSSSNDLPQEDILNRLQTGEKNELIFRIGLETYPINFINEATNEVNGFCHQFAQVLVSKLNKDYRSKSADPIGLKIVDYDKLEDPRFTSIREQRADIQCSADTKRSKDHETLDGVIFSDVFFVTGARLLVKKEKAERLDYNDKTFGNIRIGIIRNTTTRQLFKNHLSRANVYKEYPNRSGGVKGLKEGEIDAFAADDILLQGMLKKELDEQDYILFPPTHF